MRQVVITGASTGIGYAAALHLCRKGYQVFATVRCAADAARLREVAGENLVPLELNITDQSAVAAAADFVATQLKGQTLFGLVNNAGIAVPGPLLHLALDDVRQQMEVNLIAQLGVTQCFAPLLGADTAFQGKPGRIIMMSSVSGKNAVPFLGPYAASKFALEGLSESLRRELMLFGIDVILIRPGAIATPIWDKADEQSLAPYRLTAYRRSLEIVRDVMIAEGRNGLPPDKVARLVETALTHAHPRTAYTLRPQFWMGAALALMPKRLLDRIIARRLGLERKI